MNWISWRVHPWLWWPKDTSLDFRIFPAVSSTPGPAGLARRVGVANEYLTARGGPRCTRCERLARAARDFERSDFKEVPDRRAVLTRVPDTRLCESDGQRHSVTRRGPWQTVSLPPCLRPWPTSTTARTWPPSPRQTSSPLRPARLRTRPSSTRCSRGINSSKVSPVRTNPVQRHCGTRDLIL